jgi:hypothetical protein
MTTSGGVISQPESIAFKKSHRLSGRSHKAGSSIEFNLYIFIFLNFPVPSFKLKVERNEMCCLSQADSQR